MTASPATEPVGLVNRLAQTALRSGINLMLLTSDLLGDDWLSRRMRIALFGLFGARIGAGTSCHGRTQLAAPARLRAGRDCFVKPELLPGSRRAHRVG